MKPLLCDIRAAREALSVGRSKAYELMDQGVIRSVKIGQRRLVEVESMSAYVASLALASRCSSGAEEASLAL